MNTLIKIVLAIAVLGGVGFAIMYFAPKPEPEAPAPVVTVPEAPKPINTVTFVCDAGKSVTAAFFEGKEDVAPTPDKPPVSGGSVQLALAGVLESDTRTLTVPQVVSADGARYADKDESFVFWNKGNSAMVLEGGVEKNFTGCIAAAPLPEGSLLSRVFASSSLGFTLRLPSFTVSTTSLSLDAYRVDNSYRFKELGPKNLIPGIKFTIPVSMATGTNLSADSFLSVEYLASTTECSAGLFLPAKGASSSTALTENNVTYSFASSTDAAAGNRYEELVYALPGTNPCMAVRYFIHYGAIENYPKDKVEEFDRAALLATLDAVRQTLVVK